MTSRRLIHKKHLTSNNTFHRQMTNNNTNNHNNHNIGPKSMNYHQSQHATMAQNGGGPPSNTDFLLFQALANPEQIQLDKIDPNEFKKVGSSMSTAVPSSISSYNMGAPNSSNGGILSDYVRNRTGNSNQNNYNNYYGSKNQYEDEGENPMIMDSDIDNNSSNNSDEDDDNENNYFRNPKISFDSNVPNLMSSGPNSFSFSRSPGRPTYNDSSNNILSAQELCLLRNELLNYKRKGRIIDIDIENAPEHMLRTTLDYIREEESSEVMLENMRNGLQIAQYGIEWANNKMGSYIPLNGWTDNTDPHIYDHSLKRIHNLYFRNSQSHPLVELGTTMVMSGTGYSAKNIFGLNKKQNTNTTYVQPPPPRQNYNMPNNNNYNNNNINGPFQQSNVQQMQQQQQQQQNQNQQSQQVPVHPAKFAGAPLNNVFENTKQTAVPQQRPTLMKAPNISIPPKGTTIGATSTNNSGRVGMRPPFTSFTPKNNNNSNGGEPVSVIPVI